MKGFFYLLLFTVIAITKAEGQFINEKIFSDPSHEFVSNMLSEYSGKGILATGYSTSYGYYNRKISVVSMDSVFGLRWAKAYGKSTIAKIEINHSMILDDKSIVVVGSTQDSITFLNAGFVMRVDSTGNIIYVNELFDPLGNDEVEPMALLPQSDTTFVLMTHLWGKGNIAISQVNYNGQIVFTKDYRTTLVNHTVSYQSSMKRANGNCVVIANDVSTSPHLKYLEFDSNLNLLHVNNFFSGFPFQCNSIAENPIDQSLVLVGSSSVKPIVLKLDFQGNLIMSKVISSTYNNNSYNSVFVKDNTYYLSGTNVFQQDYLPYVLQMDTAGNVLNSESYSHQGQTTFFYRSVDLTDSLMILFGGHLNSDYGFGYMFTDTSLHTPCSNDDLSFSTTSEAITVNQILYTDSTPLAVLDITPQFQSSSFSLVGIDYCLSSGLVESFIESNALELINDGLSLQIHVNGSDVRRKLTIYNATFQLLKNIETTADYTTMDISGLANGIYFVALSGEKRMHVKKFIVAK